MTLNWSEFFASYLFTIAIETPVLLAGLSRPHSLKTRLAAGIWLTACTYPIVYIVLPELIDFRHNRPAYLAVAETFAPLAEGILFALVFWPRKALSRRQRLQDMAVVILANLASFLIGSMDFAGDLVTAAGKMLRG